MCTHSLARAALVLGTVAACTVEAQPTAPDAIRYRALTVDTVIAGVPCAAGARPRTEFHLDGSLAGCTLSRAHTFPAGLIPARSWVDLNRDGELWGVWLSTNTALGGFPCRGEGYKKWSTRVHPGGGLASCFLAADAVLTGIPCMKGTFWREVRGGGRTALHVHPSGRFARCMVARDVTIEGTRLAKWQIARRDDSGALIVPPR